jgi:uncharacterized protein YjlB
MAATLGAPKIEDYRFADDGRVPNNPRLPLIVYRGALKTGGDAAASCVALFDRNGWTGAWQNGVYSHHHYHSSAHEVLGIASGWVRVRLGGESGQTIELRAGDVVVIPAGVAHKNEGESPDLLVVGAGRAPICAARVVRITHGRCRKSPRCRCPPATRSVGLQGRCSSAGASQDAADPESLGVPSRRSIGSVRYRRCRRHCRMAPPRAARIAGSRRHSRLRTCHGR